MSNFKTEEFLNYLNIKLSDLFKNNCYVSNKLFDNVVSIVADVVDLFVPNGNATRKDKKAQVQTVADTLPA